MQPDREESFSSKENKQIRLILFCTPWSDPCRQQWEILNTLRKQDVNGTAISKIDLDISPELANRWSIHSIPTTLLMKGDREIDRFIGLLSADKLQALLTRKRN